MSSCVLQRGFLSLLAALAVASTMTGEARAAEPAVHQLPDATHAYSLAPGVDGSVWFAPSRGTDWAGPEGQMVGVLRADGTVGELSVPGFENPEPGPSGEVWLSGERAEATGENVFLIGRLASERIEQQYVVGRGRGRIKEMAVVPGAVWFVRRHAGGRQAIQRLFTNGGEVRRHVFLDDGCRVRAIAAGGDGALWFTEACRRYVRGRGYVKTRATIGRISPGGKTTHRPLPLQGDPVSIATGQDGSVWIGITYNGFATDLVGHITKRGTITEYVIRGHPDSIAVGDDGRVWFSSSFGRRHPALGSITPGGKRETICADPTCGLEPTELATAPDGSLWYGLTRPYVNEGGGGSGIYITHEIGNEAGLIGHLGQ